MGKAGIYVFLIIAGTAAVVCLGIWLNLVTHRLLDAAHARHRQHLADTTPWAQYLDIGDNGEYLIGIERRAEGHQYAHLEMFRLSAQSEQLDVKQRIYEAKDRAALYNNEDANGDD